MRVWKGALLALICFILAKCGGDYRPEAQGIHGDAVVVMDSTQWKSASAEAIRDVYGQGIYTLPQWEPIMDLTFVDFKNNEQLDKVKNHKNIIIAAPINDSTNTAKFIRALISKKVQQRVESGGLFAFPFRNQWYRDQWTIILTSTSDSALARKIRQNKKKLANQLIDQELHRWTYQLYKKAEQKDVEDSLWTNSGWKIRVPHDWRPHVDTTYTANGVTNHFITMRRDLPQNLRWFWAWWVDDTKNVDSLSSRWINEKRDSLMKTFIRGTRARSYVTTDYDNHPVITDTLMLDGHPAYETRGVWHMTHDAMAGPFVNMTIRDKRKGRLFMLEFGQFAPKYHKRRFVRQFRAILQTFQADSSWNPKKAEAPLP